MKAHNCCKNFTGLSTALESEIIVEGFQKSEEIHQLRYLSFIGDGDSSVFAKLKEKVSYGLFIDEEFGFLAGSPDGKFFIYQTSFLSLCLANVAKHNTSYNCEKQRITSTRDD